MKLKILTLMCLVMLLTVFVKVGTASDSPDVASPLVSYQFYDSLDYSNLSFQSSWPVSYSYQYEAPLITLTSPNGGEAWTSQIQ